VNRSEAGKLGFQASAEIQQQMKMARREQYTKNPTLCDQCATPLTFEKRRSRFCDHSCAATFVNSRRETKHKTCVDCKETFPERGASIRCQGCIEHRRIDTFEKLKTDGSRKRALISEREHRCESCGLSEWLEKQIILTLDHTDGNPDNNDKSNLKLLCWNCHAMTPTFGGKNAGRFPDSNRKKKRTEYFLRYAAS
jgi:hypothetical protein